METVLYYTKAHQKYFEELTCESLMAHHEHSGGGFFTSF